MKNERLRHTRVKSCLSSKPHARPSAYEAFAMLDYSESETETNGFITNFKRVLSAFPFDSAASRANCLLADSAAQPLY